MSNTSKVNNKWYSSLKDPAEKEEFAARVLEADRVLERLEEILTKKINSSMTELRKTSNFEKPAWEASVADQLGYWRALEEINTLIKIKHQEE